jgi:anti-sigma-K factor RskA
MTQPDLHLSERMAAVLAGRARWSDAELEHLASCEACEQEFALLGDVRRLGDGAPVIDAARLASVVVPRATAARRESRVLRIGGWSSAVLAAAAAVALVIAPNLRTPAQVPVAPPLVIAELDGLDQADLQGVLDAIDAGLPASEPVDEGAVTGLEASDVDVVLKGLEG